MIQNNKGVESRLRKLAEDFELPQGSLILINFNSTQNKSNHNSTRLALIKVGDSRISKKILKKFHILEIMRIVYPENLDFLMI